MTLGQLVRIYFTLNLICFLNMAHASVSKEMSLVGEVISFDHTHVRIRSGAQEYNFAKEDLDHPTYRVGNKIEIPFDANKMERARIKKNKPHKKSK